VFRKNGSCYFLRPNGKPQVTIEDKNGGTMVLIHVHIVLISTRHDETVTNYEIAKDSRRKNIIDGCGGWGSHGGGVFFGKYPTKIIIDTYGGWGSHGGGAFSRKDPTK
ncbi:hypothetical protein KI387_009096, partial [Taxus chinensis]